VDSDLVRIVEQDGSKCVIEVLTGKKGEFTLVCDTVEDGVKELPVKIRSL